MGPLDVLLRRRTPAQRTLLLLGLAIAPCPVACKRQSGSLRMGGAEARHRWQYLSSFGFDSGSGSYEIRLRSPDAAATGSSIHVDLEVLPPEEMSLMGSLPPCHRGADSTPRTTHKLLKVGVSGEWGPWQGNTELQNSPLPSTAFFALSSCSYLSPEYELEYELRLRQSNDSELSAELRHLPSATLLALPCLTLAVACFIARYRSGREPVEVRALSVLTLSLLLQLGSLALQTLHVWVHLVSSLGTGGAGAAGEFLAILAQALTSTLLIGAARGYQLRCKAEAVDMMRPIFLVVTLLHLVLAGVGDWPCSSKDQLFHADASLAFCVHLFARGFLLAWFLLGVRAQRQQAQNGAHEWLLPGLQMAGLAHLLGPTALALVAQALAPSLRQPLLLIGVTCLRTSAALALAAALRASQHKDRESTGLRAALLPGGAGRVNLVPLVS